MNYEQAISYLKNCYASGSKKGHEELLKILDVFGNPQEKLKIIHVCGTNGKGSTSAMLAEVLKEQGYSVGVFSSPHLSCYNERFKINNELISDDDLAENISKISEVVEKNFQNRCFSFFEVLTLIAFNYFYQKQVDFLILEVGLGGRLDSTNIIKEPFLCVITSISFDHMEYLGSTIEEIAEEKAGIIKKNSITVLYSQSEQVYNVVRNICEKNKAKLYYDDNLLYEVTYDDLEKTVFNYRGFLDLTINLIGSYQVKNACTVITAILAIRNLGVEISDKAVYNGLLKAKLFGRMEVLSKKPLFIIDGAHNIGGVYEFVSFLKKIKKETNEKIRLLIGVVKDKEYSEIVKLVEDSVDEIVITKPDNIRGLSANALYNEVRQKEKVVCVSDDYREALSRLIRNKKGFSLACCGSLYLIADIRNIILNEKGVNEYD